MKKSEDKKKHLYNFNEHDKDLKKRKKKNSKKTEKKNSFDNEIIIGITPKIKIQEENNNVTHNNKNSIKNKKRKQINKETNKTNKKNIKDVDQKRRKKKILKSLKIAKYSFLTICILAIIIAIMTSPLFNISKITVSGNERITENEIISLSEITLNENIFKTVINKSETKILENPYIKSAIVKRKLPTKIEIIIEERKINFMLEYGSGYVYINNQGYILEISNEKIDVPIIQGAETNTENFIPGNRLCTEDLNKMDTVIKIMETANNNDMENLITRIDIQNSENYIIQFDEEGKIAYLGDASDISTKMLTIKAILEREKGIEGEIFVDMDLKTSNPVFRQRV